MIDGAEAERLLDECLGSMVLMPIGQSDRYKEARAAVLAAMTAPPGWKLVPVEPTTGMICSTVGEITAQQARKVWPAMLAAAPEVPR